MVLIPSISLGMVMEWGANRFMSNYKNEALKSIRKRLETSDRKKWKMLSNEQKDLVVNTYYQIRDSDYQNINFLLREHASEKKQVAFLVFGIGLGVFANPISSVALKYFPSETGWDDLRIIGFFTLILLLFVLFVIRASTESLGEEDVIERLLEIGEHRAPYGTQE